MATHGVEALARAVIGDDEVGIDTVHLGKRGWDIEQEREEAD